MDMFGYILCSFRDSCPDFIPFRQNTPCVGSRRGTAQGAALLTKWGETAIIKTERALLLVVSFAVLHHIIMNNADRLAGTQAVSTLLWTGIQTPLRRVPVWDGAGDAALLTKFWRTAIIKTERAPLLAVGSTRFAQIDYADRLAPPRRSARFYGKCQC